MSIYTPIDLERIVETSMANVPKRDLFSKQEHKRLLEMWCASRFGIGYENRLGKCHIEIEERDEQREFDFLLIVGDLKLPFQIAEVLDVDRKRGDEYRKFSEEQVEELHHTREMQSSWYAATRIAEELDKKVSKKYAKAESLHILLYLNLNASGVAWASLAGVAENQAKAFASVWILAQDLFCCIHGGIHWHGLVGWKRIDLAS